MAHLHDERKFVEGVCQVREPFPVLLGIPERPWELHQERIEDARIVEDRQPGTRLPDLGAGPGGSALVRETAVEFGGVAEVIEIGDTVRPTLCNPDTDRTIERGVDLDQVDVVRQIPDRVEAARPGNRLEHALPVGIVPPRDADSDCGRLAHTSL